MTARTEPYHSLSKPGDDNDQDENRPHVNTEMSSSSSNTVVMTTTSEWKTSSSSSVPLARVAARGTLVTLLLRGLSFVGTQLTLRRMDPVALGKTNIQLELLLTTILFISREGFRLALTQTTITTRHHNTNTLSSSSSSSNTKLLLSPSDFWIVAWWSVAIGSFFSLLAAICHWYYFSSTLSSSDDIDYRVAGLWYCLAAWIELCGEPAVLWSLQQFQITLRASAEGLASLVKTISIAFVLPMYFGMDHRPVTSFGVAQVLYALTYTIYLYSCTRHQWRWPASKQILNSSFQSPCSDMLQHVFILSLQGLFKHGLTEADRIVLTALGNAYNQGIYAMALAYGSLAARLLFQPLEESGRLWMAKEATTAYVSDGEVDGSKDGHTGIESGQSTLEDTYTFLVKLVMYIGLLFSCVAVNYTVVLLQLLAGKKWMGDIKTRQEASDALQAFCVYTALLAANGMTEAFAYIQARTGKQVGQLTLVHALVALTFALLLAPTLIRSYGTIGLIMANGIAMFMRCCYSVVVATRYFASLKKTSSSSSSPLFRSTLWRLLRRMMPHPYVLLAFMASFVITRKSLLFWCDQGMENLDLIMSRTWWKATVQHVSVGVACVIVIGSLALPMERDLGRMMKSMISTTKKGKQHQD